MQSTNHKQYINKKVIQVNDDLRIYQYFYTFGVAIYYVPRNKDQEIVKIVIAHPSPRVEKATA